ncbi:MAG TPA: formyltransferase family protein [Solirubrobacteraceae bacterium]|nr:formyltransferase family protein [Solirubrobacteraceae bacterium]
MRADLLIGGTLGGWALERAAPATVARVVTDDEQLAARAAERGLPVALDHDYEPATRGLSVHYQRIVPARLIDRYDGLWNLHPGLLPWGRGMFPVFWALWEDTPAGASLHELVEALDAGPVVAQERVEARADDTGGSLHARVQAAEKRLFDAYWPRVVAGDQLPATPQAGTGSSHTRAEFLALKREGWRELDRERRARLERCLRFPGYSGLEVQPSRT